MVIIVLMDVFIGILETRIIMEDNIVVTMVVIIIPTKDKDVFHLKKYSKIVSYLGKKEKSYEKKYF